MVGSCPASLSQAVLLKRHLVTIQYHYCQASTGLVKHTHVVRWQCISTSIDELLDQIYSSSPEHGG